MPRLLVLGGSGVIGREVLEAASHEPTVDEVRALQRRPVMPPLARVLHIRADDFGSLAARRSSFLGVDACIFALGISQSLVVGDEYRRITIDFPLEAARRLAESSPWATFVFVSGEGADPSGRSPVVFARTKGEAEALLQRQRMGRLVIARPGAVIPSQWPRKPLPYERVTVPISKLLHPFAPGLVIRASDLGRALVLAALDRSVPELLGNRELRRMGAPRATETRELAGRSTD